MNSPDLNDDRTTSAQAADELMQWELWVAQRADELARQIPPGRDRDLECWMQAERDVLSPIEEPSRRAVSVS